MPGIPGPDARMAQTVSLGAPGPATQAADAHASAGHWEDVGHAWTAAQPEALWRLHSDAVNRRLLRRWL